ncbi:hypothetical protein FAI40_02115 [Acetobacteraceae bacterium]|nr:hypothetical protein FAI40_02115 [Acetobacteraceae bacterium]
MKPFGANLQQSAPEALSLHAFSLGRKPSTALHLDFYLGDIVWLEVASEDIRTQWIDVLSFQKGTFNGAFSFLGQHITPNLPLKSLLFLKNQMQAVCPSPFFVRDWPAIANLSFPLRLQSLSKRAIEKRCRDAVTWAGANKWMDLPVCELSNLQISELNWLRALITYPRVLLVHAQTLPCDQSFSSKIQATLENISKNGTLILIIATKMDRIIYNFWQERLPQLHVINLPE